MSLENETYPWANESDKSVVEEEEPFFLLLNYEAIIVLYSIIFTVAVIGNTLVIVTLARCRRMRTVTNLFLLNLATADLLLGVFCMPFTLIGQLLHDFIFGHVMCKLIPYFQAVSVSVSVWTLVSISLERYFAICRPLKSRSWQTRSHAYRAISGVWLGSLALCLPIAVLNELMALGNDTGRHKCREVWQSEVAEQTYNVILLIFLFVIPLFVMGVAYSMIAWRLWEGLGSSEGAEKRRTSCPEISQSDSSSTTSGRTVKVLYQAKMKQLEKTDSDTSTSRLYNQVETSKGLSGTSYGKPSPIYGSWARSSQASQALREHQKVVFLRSNDSQVGFQIDQNGMRSTYTQRSIVAKKKVIMMLYVMVLEFFVCWTPISIINTWSVFDSQIYHYVDLNCITLIQLLAYLSSCCNPITYGFMNVQFRTAFVAVFQCRQSRRRNSFVANRMADRSTSERAAKGDLRGYFCRKSTIRREFREHPFSPSGGDVMRRRNLPDL